METHFTNFDYAVFAIMGLSCIFAFFRGLVREILSLAAWVGAGIVTIYYFHPLADQLQSHFKSPAVAAGVATVSLYIGALIFFGLINMMLIKSFRRGSESGMLDNLLGLCFGALRGALIVSLGYFLITIAMQDKQYPAWVENAVTRPYAEKGATALARIAPEYMHDISTLQKKAATEMQTRQDSSLDGLGSASQAISNTNRNR